MLSAGANMMIWKTQDVLHKKPQVVPGVLMLLASSLIVYQHMTHDGEEHDMLKTFLAMILVQMLPLVALEMKIMSCADPVGLFCKFATPVTLTHAVFLGMRLVYSDSSVESSYLLCSGVGFVGALVTMCIGFRERLACVVQCYNVWGLVALALMAAVGTQAIDEYIEPSDMSWSSFFKLAFETSNSYIEILAFVPAVWMVFNQGNNADRVQVESTQTKRTSTAFFLFLVGFYVSEDLLHAYQAYPFSGLAAIAHIAHFLLLLDFAVYVLAHVYNPEKLVGELRKWLPVDFSHEV